MPEKGSDAIFVMLKFLSVCKSLSARTASRRTQFVKTVCNIKTYYARACIKLKIENGKWKIMVERSIVIVRTIQ